MTTPPTSPTVPFQKQVSMGLAALGVLALGAMGYLNIQTPEAAECAVQNARLDERVKSLTELRDQCKVALTSCIGD